MQYAYYHICVSLIYFHPFLLKSISFGLTSAIKLHNSSTLYLSLASTGFVDLFWMWVGGFGWLQNITK